MEATRELMDALLERAGLAPTPEDRERLLGVLGVYLQRLEALHAADLDNEEVAGDFSPQWDSR